jgi:hypothetical protein
MSYILPKLNVNFVFGDPTTLQHCPTGLFLHEGTLYLKTGYESVINDSPDAYVVSSGEYFWGGTEDRKTRDNKIVTPIVDIE